MGREVNWFVLKVPRYKMPWHSALAGKQICRRVMPMEGDGETNTNLNFEVQELYFITMMIIILL